MKGSEREKSPPDATNIHQMNTVLWWLRLTSRFHKACINADMKIRLNAVVLMKQSIPKSGME
jgi:hypothetical protein